MASSFLAAPRDTETAPVLRELLQESLHALLPVTAVAAWVWASVVLLFAKPHTLYAYALLALTSAVVASCYLLSRSRLRLALGVYLAGLIAAVTMTVVAFRSPPLLSLYMLVVLITALLTDAQTTWSVAIVSIALVLSVGRNAQGMELTDAALPVMLILLTALTSWVSSRRLFTALAWALSMTEESRKYADRARKHRAEVRRALKSLDEAYVRLERTNEALMIAQEAAQRAYRFKAEFVANVSHELRTPLNLITGFAGMMATAPESYGGATLPREFRGDVMAIHQSARHLSDLIDDVLDLSRIEAGRMPLVREPTDLGTVVREAADMVRGLAEARGLRLDLELPGRSPALLIDRTRIRQVLLNLLTNATRFTDRGGIRVQVQVQKQETVVIVADSGHGIPPERIARAFEAFSQLEDGQTREGSGLGLAVSKRFVELHGGRMWVESVAERGTTIGFTIPIPKDEGGAPLSLLVASSLPGEHKGQPTVLVVHDDPRIQLLLRRYVEGYRFILADSVARAREMLDEVLPAAVIVDSALAGGLTSLGAPADLPPSTPLIVCPLPSMHRLGLLLGAADYLPKPVTREDLQRALSRLPEPPRTALVVDDDAHMVRLLTRILKAGHPHTRVLRAFDGEQALELARSGRPDLILLDLIIPKVSGYEVLERLAENAATARAHVIIVSARSVEQEAAPLLGEVRIARGSGFSLTQMLQTLKATLPDVTPMAGATPDSAAAHSAARCDPPVW